jgi:hypothetical protein
VRFSGDGEMFDARFEFPEPVGGRQELHRVMHALFALNEAAAKE